AAGLELFKALLLLLKLAAEAWDLAVADLGGAAEVDLGLGGIGLETQGLQLFFNGFDIGEDLLFVFPAHFKLAGVLAQVADLFLYGFDARFGRAVALALAFGVFAEGLFLYLEAHYFAVRILKLWGLIFQ